MSDYKKGSLTLANAVAMGTGVMIGAGIFALLGQIAELSGQYFALSFIVGGVISGFSAYSYIKMADAYPSAGGIAMFLKKAYGKGTITAFAALLMAFSMVLNESLVARTFGTYTMQLFNGSQDSFLVPALGVGLLVAAFIINILGNEIIGKTAMTTAALKIGGILVFAVGALWAADFNIGSALPSQGSQNKISEYIASLALSILAYKGFTTITNSGGEVKNPHKNIGRAIILSLLICATIYFLTALAVGANLSIEQIIQAKDYSLAEAARPLFGNYGLYFTVGIAIIATITGVIFSIFAVSRMTAMLTNMKLIPHSHFGMPGNIQQHMLVYITVLSITLTILFDLSGIAAMGAIFYLIMDIIIHVGVLRHMKEKVKANPVIVITAIVLDVVVLLGFIWVRAQTNLTVIIVSGALIVFTFFGEKIFLGLGNKKGKGKEKHHHED
ncbi:APC family permease [Antarcticibacterium flavum]|uniref:APC family permease n=1 Tax=Antarcticibacterium flavum TaxID=2058175 RepID=A0A5B7X683_9FLAO|nr:MULTISPECIES: APC family permease [Antarcticibacterium]MCM4159274.1 amino acid permease [Antarcticibacterium sp. W02-3]QCY71014.1 APC family permease [Antarcticibacterium flavum]